MYAEYVYLKLHHELLWAPVLYLYTLSTNKHL